MKPCHYTTLCTSNNGKIERSTCGIYKLTYNNIILIQIEDSLKVFFEHIDSCYQRSKITTLRKPKSFVFPTVVNNIHLTFSPKEISELHYLVESALIETTVLT